MVVVVAKAIVLAPQGSKWLWLLRAPDGRPLCAALRSFVVGSRMGCVGESGPMLVLKTVQSAQQCQLGLARREAPEVGKVAAVVEVKVAAGEA